MHCHIDGVSLPEDYSRMAKFKSQAFKISYDFRASPYLQGPQEAVVVYITAKRKKDTTEKKGLVFRKNTIPKWKTCFIFLLPLLAVAGITRPAANIREPLVLGRMFGCQLHGGEEQWLFNLLFIAKPIREE